MLYVVWEAWRCKSSAFNQNLVTPQPRTVKSAVSKALSSPVLPAAMSHAHKVKFYKPSRTRMFKNPHTHKDAGARPSPVGLKNEDLECFAHLCSSFCKIQGLKQSTTITTGIRWCSRIEFRLLCTSWGPDIGISEKPGLQLLENFIFEYLIKYSNIL